MRGLALQTAYAGPRRFLLVYVAKASGRERRMVLGEYGKAPKLSVAAARKLAAEKRALVELGRDSWLEANEGARRAEAAAPRRTATLGGLLTAYVEHLPDKPSWKQVESAIAPHITKSRPKLAAKAADKNTVDGVTPVFHALATGGKLWEAGKLRAYLRAAYTAARKARTGEHVRVRRVPDRGEPARRPGRESRLRLDEGQQVMPWQFLAGPPRE